MHAQAHVEFQARVVTHTAGEALGLGYGKLVERLLKFDQPQGWGPAVERPAFYGELVDAAQLKLTGTSVPLEQPVLVLGDASASMQVCIETSTIVASLAQ